MLLAVVPAIAYAIRFEGWTWGPAQRATAVLFTELSLPVSLLVFFLFGLYRRLWRYASVAEMELIFAAGATSGAVNWIIGGWLLRATGLTTERVPLSVLFTTALMTVAVIATPRMLMRVAGLQSRRRRSKGQRRVLIAGAGKAGESIVRELRANPDLEMEPIGFVDDDVQKHGMRLGNLPVLGTLRSLPPLIKENGITDILIAMPRASGPT